jgi:bacteriocin biosynthesis cyclodehydratase domain-containing protein
VATFLAASGVGRVACFDPEPAEPADLAPAGLTEAELGQPRQDGAARAVARAAAGTRTRDDGTVPDLVVLTRPALPDLAGGLQRARVPHLAVSAGEAIGVVGPLVRPGRSACLRCVDLHKAEADPHWPKVSAQATLASRIRPEACDTALAAMTAALACAQALVFIDRAAGEPAAVGGTLEVVLPDWQWRRRTWPPHPACGCGAAGWARRDGPQPAGLCRNGAVTDAA